VAVLKILCGCPQTLTTWTCLIITRWIEIPSCFHKEFEIGYAFQFKRDQATRYENLAPNIFSTPLLVQKGFSFRQTFSLLLLPFLITLFFHRHCVLLHERLDLHTTITNKQLLSLLLSALLIFQLTMTNNWFPTLDWLRR
jgi:hypothetical protein